ncbi:MAG: hypothetical protein KC448_06065 [Yoonia sp.]|nr:hypothetical protein [Yoonia sp.]
MCRWHPFFRVSPESMRNWADPTPRSCALGIVESKGSVHLERERPCEVEDIADCVEAFEPASNALV